MNYKPMLAVDCGDLSALTFPRIASPKLDGVRAIMSDTGVLSRALKMIPNKHVQALYGKMEPGLDGEFIVGDPCAPDAYRKTVSVVMSDDKPIDGLVFYLFDKQMPGTFLERQGWDGIRPYASESYRGKAPLVMVRQVTVNSLEELLAWEAVWVKDGYEGAILRKPDSPYKHGRSTVPEGYLLKLKRFVDGEAVVIGVTELMHNGNAAKTNELGRTAHSHKKAGMVGMGTLGALRVRDVETGVEFEIGTGFTAQERADIWALAVCDHEGTYEGCPACFEVLRERVAKYKHFPSGAKDKPRHPVFLGWRDKRDR